MSLRYRVYVGLCALILSISCNNKLDVYAPPKEIMVVYALLNSSDSVHYIKVNKAFVSENSNAVELAKEPDALFFDSLKVELISHSDGSRYLFTKDSSIKKDSGAFSHVVNYLYKSNVPLVEGHTYKVLVTNPLTGNQAEGITRIVHSPSEKTPSRNPISINNFSITPATSFLVSYEAGQSSKIYDITLRMFYDETDATTGITRRDTLNWRFASGKFVTSRLINIRIPGQLFYDYVGSNIPIAGPKISRKAIALEFEYWAGDENLATYIDAFNGSVGIVQKKNDYTNVQNGYGIVASRNRYTITGTMISKDIRDNLEVNPSTTVLNFVD